MKFIVYLFLGLLVVLTSNVIGQEDEQFQQFLLKLNTRDLAELEKVVVEEREKFESSHEDFHNYNSKYTQSLIERIKGNVTDGLRLLIWIDEQCPDCQTSQFHWVRYEIASNLSALKANKLSQEYILPLAASEYGVVSNKLKLISQDLAAYNFFELKNYKGALELYKRSLSNYRRNKNWLMASSMLNNIGICHLQLKNNSQSLFSFKMALKEVSKEDQNSIGDFKYTIIGNIGTCYDSLKMYPEAISNLKIEFYHYLYSGENHKYLAGTFSELIQLCIKTKQIKEAEKLILKLDKNIDLYLKENKESVEGQIILQVLVDFYIITGNDQKALYYSQLLLDKQTVHMEFIKKQSYELNEILYRNKLKHLKSNAKIQQIESQQSDLQMKLSVVIFSFVIIFLLVVIGASIRFNNQKKEALLKDKLIAQQNTEILQDDLKVQREKTNNLALYLNLKRETEKAFLFKIKELKRRKNTDTETVLKDLQISVSNMIHVDKKAIFKSAETNDILGGFKKNLSTKHPLLSKLDLEYCCYFRLEMSAKEIGSLFGQSDISIRVMKNKIKNKIGLSAGANLNDYLSSLND